MVDKESKISFDKEILSLIFLQSDLPTRVNLLTCKREFYEYYKDFTGKDITINLLKFIKTVDEEYYVLSNGYRHGKVKYFKESGQIRGEANYFKGKRHGKAIFYGVHGTICEEKHYVDGLLHGNVKRWDISGELYYDVRFIRGEIDPHQDFSKYI